MYVLILPSVHTIVIDYCHCHCTLSVTVIELIFIGKFLASRINMLIVVVEWVVHVGVLTSQVAHYYTVAN